MQEIIQFIVGFILAMTVNWRMSLILVSTTPLTFGNYMIMSTISTIITRRINRLTKHSASVSNEITGCIRTIKSMAGEEKEIERFKEDMYKINRNGLYKGFAHSFAYGVAAVVTWGTVALGFWYGGSEVAEGKSTIGEGYLRGREMLFFKNIDSSLLFIPKRKSINGLMNKLLLFVLLEGSYESIHDRNVGENVISILRQTGRLH